MILYPLFLALVAADPGVDFDTQVMPVLTKAGCNAGACHGAASGRGGFRLSLLGSDPAGDHNRIVHELEGRRVNLARPAESLLLAKATEQLPHGGGQRLDYEGPDASRIQQWIEAGAPRINRRQLTRFEVRPSEQVVERPGDSIQVRAIAHFTGGETEDVTPWTVFTPSDPAGLEAQPDGRITVRRGGQHTLILRYMNQVVAVRLTLPLSDAPVDLAAEPRANFIDDEILAALATLRLRPAPQADDAAFLRRLRLDLTGTLPAPDEIRGFLEDTQPGKRQRLIDRLLETHEFVDYWTLQWAERLRISSQSLQPEGAQAFHQWVRAQVAANAPLDAMATAMLVSLGDSFETGPANFSRATRSPRDQAEFVSEALLGVRLRCANCHDHPLDRWTQDDYHGLAAIFARIEQGRVVRLAARGEVTHPRSGEPALPRLPGMRFVKPGEEGRESLARWITDKENPYFARAAVNRLWKSLLGRGLVEPVDDLRATNPATHPALLDRLAADFIEHGYDLRHTLRLIVSSAAYARGSVPNAGSPAAQQADDRFYSRALLRPLGAEVLADAYSDVTGLPDRFGDLPLGTRAIALVDSRTASPALDVLGRCPRDGSCEAVSSMGSSSAMGLSQKLHLINGELLNGKIAAPEGRLHQLLAAGRSDHELLEEFYLRCFGRLPKAEEHAFWARQFAAIKDPAERRQRWEDLLWSLLNCREFTTR